MTPSTTTPITRSISREHLKQMIDRKVDFTLIEVLAAEKFNDFHLPGAVNIPLNDQFDTAIVAAVSDKNRKVVVYCADRECDASTRAAQKLATLGYSNVQVFEEGKKGWRELTTTAAPVAAPSIRPAVVPFDVAATAATPAPSIRPAPHAPAAVAAP